MKKAAIIFALALLARVAFDLALLSHGDASFLASGDSDTYRSIAENLLEHGAYASTPGLIPDNHRPPLYPLFLIPFIALGSPYVVIAIVQGILVSLTASAAYLFAQKIFREGVAFAAALLFALEPGGLLYSALILSEPLFVFFFVPALFYLALSIHTRNPWQLVLSSMFLALSALVRALAFVLVILLPLGALWTYGWRLPWKSLALAAVMFALIISPWMLFNVRTFSSPEFSSTASRNLYQDNAATFERWLYPEKKEYFFTIENRENIVGRGRVQTVEGAHELGAVARAFILEHPVQYAVFHTLYMPRLFIHDGYNDVYRKLTGREHERNVSLYDSVAALDFSHALDSVRAHPEMIVYLLAKLGFLGVALLFFIHPLLSWKSKDRALLRVSLFFVGFVLLYAFLASPVGMARFRFVIHPILFLLAFDTLRILLGSVQQRMARHREMKPYAL